MTEVTPGSEFRQYRAPVQGETDAKESQTSAVRRPISSICFLLNLGARFGRQYTVCDAGSLPLSPYGHNAARQTA